MDEELHRLKGWGVPAAGAENFASPPEGETPEKVLEGGEEAAPRPEELLAGDAFRRVWARVARPNGPVAVDLPEEQEEGRGALALLPEKVAGCGRCFSGGNPESRALQGLILEMVSAAGEYRALARREGRIAAALRELEREKVRQGKRLAAAYFLMTGVRYWPPGSGGGSEGLLPALRRRFQREERLAKNLEALAGRAFDRCLRELYGDLARETEEIAARLRRLTEEII